MLLAVDPRSRFGLLLRLEKTVMVSGGLATEFSSLEARLWSEMMGRMPVGMVVMRDKVCAFLRWAWTCCD